MKKILGIDYGDKRMGLALSDSGGIIACGIRTELIRGLNHAAEIIIKTAKINDVQTIVLGYPKNLNGTESPMSAKVNRLKLLLEKNISGEMDVVLFDERLSTAYAHKLMNITDTCGKKRKDNIDTLAAQIILQDYLDFYNKAK